MELTTAMLSPYRGGQVEIQNPTEGYMHRGEIEDAYISGHDLIIRLVWMAKAEGFPPLPERWVNDPENLSYGVSLTIYSVSGIPEGRIVLIGHVNGETAVLYPAGGSTLDPSKVEGLELTRS